MPQQQVVLASATSQIKVSLCVCVCALHGLRVSSVAVVGCIFVVAGCVAV